MTTGSWQPTPEQTPLIDEATLRALATDADNATQIIRREPYSGLSYLMKQPATYWQQAAASLDDDTLWALIKFFTLAEEADQQWYAGEDSPAIHLNTLLKQRGIRLTKEQLHWIRGNSNNRFIPNGPIKL